MRKINLYTPDGWVDIPSIRLYMSEKNLPFLFCFGGRGIGKTYGALQNARQEAQLHNSGFVYLRRTQTQADMCAKPELSPFKQIDNDNGYLTRVQPITKYTSGFYDEESKLLGYTAALSTLSNIRGVSMQPFVDLIIYDEFIPERHERPIKHESDALFNAYETISRNVELSGKAPVQLCCYANANDVGNPIFTGLGIVNTVHKMNKQHRSVWEIPERGILLINLDNSPISAKKADTALYRLTSGSGFSEMALHNVFQNAAESVYKSVPLNECKPIVTVGELTIYEHKANGSFFVTTHKAGSPVQYGSGDTDLARFKAGHIWLWREYLTRNVVFLDYSTELLFKSYYGVR